MRLLRRVMSDRNSLSVGRSSTVIRRNGVGLPPLRWTSVLPTTAVVCGSGCAGRPVRPPARRSAGRRWRRRRRRSATGAPPRSKSSRPRSRQRRHSDPRPGNGGLPQHTLELRAVTVVEGIPCGGSKAVIVYTVRPGGVTPFASQCPPRVCTGQRAGACRNTDR